MAIGVVLSVLLLVRFYRASDKRGPAVVCLAFKGSQCWSGSAFHLTVNLAEEMVHFLA